MTILPTGGTLPRLPALANSTVGKVIVIHLLALETSGSVEYQSTDPDLLSRSLVSIAPLD